MPFTEAERKWISENMKEDFTVGFSESLRFVDGELRNNPGNVPQDEAESDGYFCMKCGKTQIPDVEEHVRECMYLNVKEDSKNIYILYPEGPFGRLVGPFKTISDALNIAKNSNTHSCIITLHGNTIRNLDLYAKEITTAAPAGNP